MEPGRNRFEQTSSQQEVEGVERVVQRLAGDAQEIREISGEFEINANLRARAERLGQVDLLKELELIKKEAEALQKSTKQSLAQRAANWIKQSRGLKVILASAALHIPLSPLGQKAWDEMKELISAETEETEEVEEEEVLRLQTDEEYMATKKIEAERLQRIRPGEVEKTKQELRERMEGGEALTYKELYLRLEQANGVLPEEVEAAEKIADQKIEEYSKRFGDSIDHAELKQFVSEMYGPAENHVEGQSSVAAYFNTGKHTCISFGRGTLIVLEGIIAKLPKKEQSKYALSENGQYQHQVGQITITDDENKQTTYFLESDVLALKEKRELPGTKSVSLETLKRALIAEKPLVFKVAKGENVKSGPRLIFYANQPVDDGIELEGKLAGSDFVVQEAEKQNKFVEKQKPVDPTAVMEFATLTSEEIDALYDKTGPKLPEDKKKNDKKEQEKEFSYLHNERNHVWFTTGATDTLISHFDDAAKEILDQEIPMTFSSSGMLATGMDYIAVDAPLPLAELKRVAESLGKYKKIENQKGSRLLEFYKLSGVYKDGRFLEETTLGDMMFLQKSLSMEEAEVLKESGVQVIYFPEIAWNPADGGPIPWLRELDGKGIVTLFRSMPYAQLFLETQNAFPDLRHLDKSQLALAKKELESDAVRTRLLQGDLMRAADAQEVVETIQSLLQVDDDKEQRRDILLKWNNYIQERAKSRVQSEQPVTTARPSVLASRRAGL